MNLYTRYSIVYHINQEMSLDDLVRALQLTKVVDDEEDGEFEIWLKFLEKEILVFLV